VQLEKQKACQWESITQATKNQAGSYCLWCLCWEEMDVNREGVVVLLSHHVALEAETGQRSN